MATTAISICSAVCVLLGAGRISSFDEETDLAIICKTAYFPLRRAMMGKYPWSFLNKKFLLAKDGTPPVAEWSNSFIIPGDSVSGLPRAIYYSKGDRIGSDRYEIVGRRVFTNEGLVYADFGIDLPESEWPPHFEQAVKYAMLAEVAFPITDQQNTAEYWAVKAFGNPGENGQGGAFGEATTIDAQGAANLGLYADAFVDARTGGSGYADFTWPGVA